MTKTRRLQLAREVRRRLSLYINLQDPRIRDYVRNDLHEDPAVKESGHLVRAAEALTELMKGA